MQRVCSNTLPTFRHYTNNVPKRFPTMSGHDDGGHNAAQDDIHDFGHEDDNHDDDGDHDDDDNDTDDHDDHDSHENP